MWDDENVPDDVEGAATLKDGQKVNFNAWGQHQAKFVSSRTYVNWNGDTILLLFSHLLFFSRPAAIRALIVIQMRRIEKCSAFYAESVVWFLRVAQSASG